MEKYKKNYTVMSNVTHDKLQKEYSSVILVLDFTKIGIPKNKDDNVELKMQIDNDLKEDEIIINIENNIHKITLEQYKKCIVKA